MTTWTKVRIGIVGVALAVSPFIVSKGDVKNFNDKVVAAAKAVDEAFGPLSTAMDAYAKGEKVDTAKLDRDIASVGGACSHQLSILQHDLAVPDDDLCRSFHGSALAYVQNSQGIQQKYVEVSKYMAAHNPAGPNDFMAVMALFGDLLAKDESLFKEVGARQKQMADKFSLKLE